VSAEHGRIVINGGRREWYELPFNRGLGSQPAARRSQCVTWSYRSNQSDYPRAGEARSELLIMQIPVARLIRAMLVVPDANALRFLSST
jgi:hypothetical protein